MQLLIGCWAWNFFIIQDACDLVCADPVKSHGKDPPYHFGCFRVDDEFSFCIWVFAVSIPCKRADEQPLFPLVVKHRADIGGQIFQIPLVDQAVDLAGFFVRGIVGIHMVYHRNEADAPLHELSVQILFHELHVTGETGLRFGQYHIKPMFACGLQHRIERRAVPVDAGIVLIRIDLVNIKSVFQSVLEQHRLLILNALRFTNFIFIFFAQAAINCCFHDLPPSFCTRASMRSITHPSFQFRDAASGTGAWRNGIEQSIDDISLKFLLKPFFALFVVVRAKFFVQNKRSFFHRIPLFGPSGRDMCLFSLFPVSEIQNFPYFSCKILQDVQNQLETPLPQWYNYTVILWKLGAKPRADRPQAPEFLWDV